MSFPSKLSRPTDAELAILNVLWQRGEATVREVHEALYGADGGYTTALKMLQVMHGKGLVERDISQRAHVYRAVITQRSAQKRALGDLLQGFFNGNAGELVLRALGAEQTPSAAELGQIRALIDRLEKEHDDE